MERAIAYKDAKGRVFYFGPFAYAWTAEAAMAQIEASGAPGQAKIVSLIPWYSADNMTTQMERAK